jgi:hypothetical protein
MLSKHFLGCKNESCTLGKELFAVESTGVSMDMSIQQTFPRIPLHYMSGRSDKNIFIHKSEVSRKVTLNQVSHHRRKTRREDSHSPVKMEQVLGSH